MKLNALIDAQIDRGTATNQVLVWNDTSKRFEVTLSPSGLTSIGVTGTGTFGQIDVGGNANIAETTTTKRLLAGGVSK